MNRFRKVFRSEDGFTLIELLVVIAVLAILAALAVPRLGGLTDRARISEGTNALNSFKTALEMYNVEHNGNYPDPDISDNDFVTEMEGYIDNLAEIQNNWDVLYEDDGGNNPDSNQGAAVTLEGINDAAGLSVSLVKSDVAGSQWQIID
ncbi:MAG: type II secretion system protein [Halanaerobiaceae bacterium]